MKEEDVILFFGRLRAHRLKNNQAKQQPEIAPFSNSRPL